MSAARRPSWSGRPGPAAGDASAAETPGAEDTPPTPAPTEYRAATLVEPGRIDIVKKARAELQPGQVEVRVEGCGVCGSNLAVWEGRPWFEFPLPPGQPGHEGWGTVARVGDGVDTLSPGQRVAFLSQAAFAEYDVTPADQVVALPPELKGPFPGEALACAMNVMRRSGIEQGHTVAVVGVGFLGALLVQLATRRGARVLALSRRAFALEVGWSMGAAERLSLEGSPGVVERVRGCTDGSLCDVVIEAAGLQSTLDLASELVCVGGRLVVAGYHQDGLRQVNMQMWNWRGIDVINAHERDPQSYVRGMREAVEAVADGQLDFRPLMTHSLPLDQLDLALELVRLRPPGFLKAVVTP